MFSYELSYLCAQVIKTVENHHSRVPDKRDFYDTAGATRFASAKGFFELRSVDEH